MPLLVCVLCDVHMILFCLCSLFFMFLIFVCFMVYLYLILFSSCYFFFFFCKQKTAYEMRFSDWSSDVCSSDLDSGEDAIAFSTGSDYAANIETAQAALPGPRPAAGEDLRKIDTPTQKTCEDVAALMGIELSRTAKSIALVGADGDGNAQFVLALVRGDHDANELKLAKVEGLADYRMATHAEILAHLGSEPGFLGPVAPRQPVRVPAGREVAAMADFVVGANEPGFHLAGVNWGRALPEQDTVADIRSVVEGDRAADRTKESWVGKEGVSKRGSR